MKTTTKIAKLVTELINKGLSFEVKESFSFQDGRSYSVTILDDSLSNEKVKFLIKQGFDLEGGFFVLWFDLGDDKQ